MPSEEIYLKAWDIYQARISSFGEARWKVLMLAVAGEAGLASYGFVNRLPQLYAVAIVLCLICFYIEYLYIRLQQAYIAKSRDVERALREIVVEEPDPHIPRNVVNTDPRMDEMPNFLSLMKWKRAAFWIPYCVLILAMVLAMVFGFIAPCPA